MVGAVKRTRDQQRGPPNPYIGQVIQRVSCATESDAHERPARMEIVGSGAIAHWGLLVRFMDPLAASVDAVYYCELTLTDEHGCRKSARCTYYVGKVDIGRVDEFLHANNLDWLGDVIPSAVGEPMRHHLMMSPRGLLQKCSTNSVNGRRYDARDCNCQVWVKGMGVTMPHVRYVGIVPTIALKIFFSHPFLCTVIPRAATDSPEVQRQFEDAMIPLGTLKAHLIRRLRNTSRHRGLKRDICDDTVRQVNTFQSLTKAEYDTIVVEVEKQIGDNLHHAYW